MKTFKPVLGLLLLSSLMPVRAQVRVEITLEQEQFLPGEALPAAVKIANRSGQTLRLGRDPGWLTFSVESRDGFVVPKSGEVPVTGEFTLESAQVATHRVDLAPCFALTRPGRYSVTATLRIKEWDGQITSPPKAFDVIYGAELWSQEFGLPAAPGATNRTPDIRRYTLQQANHLKSELRLYVRLTDETESKVLKVIPIGMLVGSSRPEQLVDRLSHLHLIYQNGARSFSYTVINPDGEIIARQTHDYIGTRPRLKVDEEGNISVIGGQRRVTNSDLPAREKKEDEPKTPKP